MLLKYIFSKKFFIIMIISFSFLVGIKLNFSIFLNKKQYDLNKEITIWKKWLFKKKSDRSGRNQHKIFKLIIIKSKGYNKSLLGKI